MEVQHLQGTLGSQIARRKLQGALSPSLSRSPAARCLADNTESRDKEGDNAIDLPSLASWMNAAKRITDEIEKSSQFIVSEREGVRGLVSALDSQSQAVRWRVHINLYADHTIDG